MTQLRTSNPTMAAVPPVTRALASGGKFDPRRFDATAVKISLHAEIMQDGDNGEPILVAATSPDLSDLRETTPDQLRAKADEIHAEASKIGQLADRFEGHPPYTPPTDCDVAARITAAGEKGAILNAYLYTPTWDGKPDGPTRLSVYSEPNGEGDLDLAGALDLRAQMLAFLPKLDAMIGVLAGDVQTEPPENQKAEVASSGTAGEQVQA